MLKTNPAASRIENRWDDAHAKAISEADRLVYRSNLLGYDKRVTNYGGGNTSAKLTETDALTGEKVEVLWVKGSGGDLGSIKRDGFATLYMDKLNAMKRLYRGVEHEDAMVDLLPHATFGLNPRAASIDTPLHAFLPFKHVDHVHPDAVIAIAASKNSKQLTHDIYGDEIGWLPWKRPGFELGLWLEKFAREHPKARGCVLESHGLFTWADDGKACYELTLDAINRAIAWFEREISGKAIFGGEVVAGAPGRTSPRHRRAADAGNQEPDRQGRTEGRALRRFRRRARIRRLEAPARVGRARHVLPGSFPADKIWPLVVDFDLADAENMDRVATMTSRPWRTIGIATPLTMSAAKTPIRRRFVTPIRWCIWLPE